MQFELLKTAFDQLNPQANLTPGNSTSTEEIEEELTNSQTMLYFNAIFPVMMSMGYGGTALAFGY